MDHPYILSLIRHSPRTAYSPWTNGLVEVQNRNLGTHLRMFLHDTPKYWAFQVHMYAYAHNSQPLSELNISRHEIVFHTRPRIPLTFDLNLNRDTSKTCLSRYCSQLPAHSHYDKSNLNPFFYKTLSKPIPHWFLAIETAMLQIYSTVYENTLRKINSHAYITKTYNEGKPLPIGTFVLKRNFTHVHFGLDHTKFLTDYQTSHMNYLHKMALQYTSTEIIYFHIIQKNHSYIHTCVVLCAFQTQLNFKFHNLSNMQTVILLLLTQTNRCQKKIPKHP